MMVSPEGYYEMELQGKSVEDIAKKIRGLKNEIGHLKKAIEAQHYGEKTEIYPDERTRLWCTRLYLERAIAAYVEAGGKYQPSKAEQRETAFDEAVPTIARLIFTIGGYFDGVETRTFTLTDDHLRMDIDLSKLHKPSNFYIEPDYLMSKEEFLDGFRELHIGEWRRYYDSFDYGWGVLDGTSWNLVIEYIDGRKVEYGGSNAYPYNFDRFCELIGYEVETEDEEDEE